MTLEDGLREVSTLSRIYAPWSNIHAFGGMCHDMEKGFFGLMGGVTGRVKLRDLRDYGGVSVLELSSRE